MLESKIEQAVTKYALSQGWLSYKFVSPANRSVPDRIYLKEGRVIFIEFKATGKKPSKLQTYTHLKFTDHGFPVYVIDNIEDGKHLMKG